MVNDNVLQYFVIVQQFADHTGETKLCRAIRSRMIKLRRTAMSSFKQTERLIVYLAALALGWVILNKVNRRQDPIKSESANVSVTSKSGVDTASFIREIAFYDNRRGIIHGSYNLKNPNVTDYSETGDKTTRILKLLKGKVRAKIMTNLSFTEEKNNFLKGIAACKLF